MFLELRFALRGHTLPADHGYALYSALKKEIVEPNNDLPNDLPDELLLSSIPGVPDKNGTIYLSRSSYLRLRCPAEQIQQWYRGCQNQVLDINGHLIRLIQPRIEVLETSSVLSSRLVVFKLKTVESVDFPVYFQRSCYKALEKLEIAGRVFIDSSEDGDLARRALKIKNKSIIGYGVVVEGLNAEDSLKLQSHGLGGRKHFGCGWFYPVEAKENAA